MLGKLIKYDLKSMLKTIVPLWITVIVLSGIFAIKYWGGATNTMDMGNNTFDLVLFIVLFSVAVAIVVMNILFVVYLLIHFNLSFQYILTNLTEKD